MTQIWIALCAYLLLAFIKFQSKLTKTMQQILRVLQLNLFEKRDLMFHQYNQEDIEAQLQVKDVFDPKWLLNASKVFPLTATESRRPS